MSVIWFSVVYSNGPKRQGRTKCTVRHVPTSIREIHENRSFPTLVCLSGVTVDIIQAFVLLEQQLFFDKLADERQEGCIE